jgi:hypothetical protein
MSEFAGGLCNELVGVSFSTSGVKIVYVPLDGQHVSSTIEAY